MKLKGNRVDQGFHGLVFKKDLHFYNTKFFVTRITLLNNFVTRSFIPSIKLLHLLLTM